jgi:MoaA/NifB/PqqE/SkfB family radical SAM enzyme
MKVIEVCHRNFKENSNYFSLHWSVTNNCNYKCDYCGVYRHEKIYDFDKIIDYINHIGTFNNVDTVLFGGEPLIHPNILQIVKELKTNIRICTNLSRDIEFFKELVSIKNDLKIIASYHFHKETFERFMEKFKYLVKHTKFIKVKVMFDSRYREQCKKVYYLFKAFEHQYKNCKIYLDMVYHDICDFNEEDFKFFELTQDDNRFYLKTEEGEQYTSYNQIRRLFNGFPSYYGYECDCGKSGLFIDSDGSVYYCQTKKNTGSPIFNLNKDDYHYYYILDGSIICDQRGPCYEVVIPRRIND